ncbi:MAG: ATP-binding protein [Bacteroidales bacterium]|nr:ATP-binding protein [Bacteroidales bacterium]
MGTTLQRLPIGIQGFEKIREEGFLYVDKTRQVYDLTHTNQYYFLSRPRRFGKSLLLSTIRHYYEGRRDLFEGLYIATVEKEWKKHPVLYLDLNTNKFDKPEVLESKLDDTLHEWEEVYGAPDRNLPLGMRFEKVIRKAHEKTGLRTVILVDEYDKPMLQAIGNTELQDAYRATLKGFYGALKSMDEHIQFAMLTGVTKFGKVSVFSDLNNLKDISMDRRYYDICGITEEELLANFPAHIDRLAEANRLTRDECIERLRKQYDGYHFEETALGVYNPFSVLNTFDRQKFGSYWFETGTPSYLAYLLRTHNYNLEQMATCQTSAKVLNSVDANSTNPIPVIYQSGYLTIKGYDEEFGTYQLGFPNKEVESGFVDYLMAYYTPLNDTETAFNIQCFVQDVRAGRTEQFLERLRSLFADTPYELVKDLENHYQNVIWIVAKLMGFYVQAEYRTSRGRIDLVLKAPDYCYVMEFKLDGTAEEALAQIKDRNYTLPFQLDGQKIIRIGLNFSKEHRNIERYVVEEC